MRIKRGSGLIDYVVPTLLIGVVVGAGIVALVNNNLLLNFITNSGNAKYNKGKLSMSSQGTPDAATKTMILAPKPKVVTTTSISAGQLKGTQENPVSKCSGNTCSIDYGSYVLNGLPEDFEGYVGSSGTSGGTEKLVAIIDQLIEEASKSDIDMDLALLKQLSNQGHSLAIKQKNGEDYALTIGNAKSDNISNELAWLSASASRASEVSQQMMQSLEQINQKYSNPANQAQANILNTVNVLGKDILEKNEQYTAAALSTYALRNDPSVITKSDDAVGSQYIKDGTALANNLEAILVPQYSEKTNVKSTIICATGKYSDDGKSCK